MKVIEPGHVYQLNHLDGTGSGLLTFVNRETGTEHEGAQTQEVLRALIDRTQHCDGCLRWDGNDKIIHHLRMALALHESRAIERKAEKGVIEPEKVPVAADGHFELGAYREVMPASSICIGDHITITALARAIGKSNSVILKTLCSWGLNGVRNESSIDFDTARAIATVYGVEVAHKP